MSGLHPLRSANHDYAHRLTTRAVLQIPREARFRLVVGVAPREGDIADRQRLFWRPYIPGRQIFDLAQLSW